MFVIGNNTFGGVGFVPAANKGYLRTATGYPLSLTKTLNKEPESLTVYGASGGVGDKTVNLFNKEAARVALSGNIPDDNYAVNGTVISGQTPYHGNSTKFGAPISVESDTAYTLRFYLMSGAIKYAVYASDGTALVATTRVTHASEIVRRFTAPEGEQTVYFMLESNTWNTAWSVSDVMVVDGTYTSQTMPDYVPYGYEIPLSFDDGTTSKNINLYSDSQLNIGDVLTVTPTTHEATRTSGGVDTVISGYQDWTQDLKLPKAEELTVSAGTTVAPNNGMVVEYWSSNKEAT